MFENISKSNLWIGGFVPGFVIGFLCMLSVYSTMKDTDKTETLQQEIIILKDYIKLLEEESNRLQEENQRFGSMLAEKENEKAQ